MGCDGQQQQPPCVVSQRLPQTRTLHTLSRAATLSPVPIASRMTIPVSELLDQHPAKALAVPFF
jgi:hypothetical protein